MRTKSYNLVVTFLAFILIVAAGGCKTDIGIAPDEGVMQGDLSHHNIGVGIFAESSNLKDNSVTITSAKFVMRQLRIHASGNDLGEGIRMDPYVVYIDMYPRVVPLAVAKVAPGSYHLIKFQIHKPDPNENIPDQEFIEANGQNYSFIIKGNYNGTPFIYKSRLTAARGVNIEGNPVFVQEGTILYITLRLNPYSWFDDNGSVLNPLDEGNRQAIDRNIKESFKRAFKDLDRNGEPDNLPLAR